MPRGDIDREKDPSRLDASWVQENQTRGFHAVGFPIDIGPPVGLVLRPSGTSIRCVYPVDGATDGRDGKGCGPINSDPRHGSQGYDHASWYRKVLVRAEIVQEKNSLFGPNRTWESIPCSGFFDDEFPGVQIFGTAVARRTHNDDDDDGGGTHYDWFYQTGPQCLIDYKSYILGHTLCNRSAMPPEPSPARLGNATIDLIYVGPSSWPPHEWPAVVELMQSALDDPPFSLQEKLKIWNELVLDAPIDDEEFASRAVQAVFYIKGTSGIVVEEIARRIAQREAVRLRKPLLFVDLSADGSPNTNGGDLFRCSETEDVL